jgi:hypothetical protein
MSGPIDGTGYTGGDVTGQQGTDTGTPGVNPSWNEYLGEIPQELHDKVIPAFQKWDQGVQQRFDQVHQQYKPLEEWKPLVDAGVDYKTADFAVRLLGAIEENPQMVYKTIGDYYKLNEAGTSGQGQEEPNNTEVDPYGPQFAELNRQNEIMARYLVEQRSQQEAAQAEAELDRQLADMHSKYKSRGDFDEGFVLAYMANGMDAEDAVKKFYEHRDGILQQYGQKPLIMGSGGGVPQFNNADVRKMSDGDTKNLVVQMLQSYAAQKNQ